MYRTLYVGIDLAWKIGNPFFVSTIEEEEKGRGKILDVVKKNHNNVLSYLDKKTEKGKYERLFISIDAPLIVKNYTGARECEKELAKAYGRFKATPHPTNFKKKYVKELVQTFIPKFIKDGYSITLNISLFKRGIKKLLFEIYPHPAMVEIFGLKERLRYKKGSKKERRKGLKKLIELLITLEKKSPQLIEVKEEIEEFIKVKTLDTYKRMKEVEDFLDAIFCAYISFYIGYWLNRGEVKWKVFGSDTDGFIIVPTI